MNRVLLALILLLSSFPMKAGMRFEGVQAYATSQPSVYDFSDVEGTICFWVYDNRSFAGGNMHLWFRAYQLSPLRLFDILAYSDGFTYAGWYNSSVGDGRFTISSSLTPLTQSRWHHILVTWENAGNTTLYIDGASVGSIAYSAGTRWDVGAGDGLNLALYGAEGADCYMDDVRIYNRVLAANEIRSLASSRSRLVITDSLFAWWKLDDRHDGLTCASTQTVLDYSGNGRHLSCSTTGATLPTWFSSSAINYP